MKKFALSFLVIFTFGLYALFQRFNNIVTTPVIINTQPVKQLQAISSVPVNQIVKTKPASGWNDGTFLGSNEDAYYGNVQVQAVISGGRLTDVIFLNYPQDNNRSKEKSAHATPILKTEAISSQSANVNTVSGATYTSEAFKKSLTSALAQAKA